MRDFFENDSRAMARAAARAELKNIVRRVGGKVAEAATGLAQSHISKALSDDPGDRFFRDEHVDGLLSIATPAEVEAYFIARLGAYGLRPGPIKPRTVAERLAALEEKVARRFGEAGADLVDAERAAP